MFVNLHTLPRDQHMYTFWVSPDPEGDVQSADEIDLVLSATANAGELMRLVLTSDEYLNGYEGQRIVAIADQSTGEKLWAETGINA